MLMPIVAVAGDAEEGVGTEGISTVTTGGMRNFYRELSISWAFPTSGITGVLIQGGFPVSD